MIKMKLKQVRWHEVYVLRTSHLLCVTFTECAFTKALSAAQPLKSELVLKNHCNFWESLHKAHHLRYMIHFSDCPRVWLEILHYQIRSTSLSNSSKLASLALRFTIINVCENKILIRVWNRSKIRVHPWTETGKNERAQICI